jgi:hypothetical protein
MRAPIRPLLLALSVLLSACDPGAGPGAAGGRGGEGGSAAAPAPKGRTVPIAKIREPIPWASDSVGQDRPDIVALPSGEVWISSQDWDGTRDVVHLALLGSTGDPVVVHRAPAHVYGTALGVDSAGRLHVVWSEQRNGDFALRERLYAPAAEGGTLAALGPATDVVARGGARLLEPRLATDPEGGLLLVYTLIEDTELHVRARATDGAGAWGEAVDVSEHGFSNWAPSVCAVAPGRFAVAWDRAVDGDYDVLLARISVDDGQGTVTDRMRVTDTPAFEAHASVAAAGERLYVAYEVGGENWGREGSTNKLDEALHFARTIEIVAIEGDRMAPLDEPFMERVRPALESNCEKPVIHVDGTGNLMLAFRGLPLPPELQLTESAEFKNLSNQRGGGGAGWRTSIWFTYVSRYNGATWSYRGGHHEGVPGSNGRSDAPSAFCALPKGGVAMVTVGDGRERGDGGVPGQPGVAAVLGTDDPDVVTDGLLWWCPITLEAPGVAAQRIGKGAEVGDLPLGEWRDLPAWKGPSTADDPVLITRTLPDGREVQLALGDLHRHTDLSRCSSNWDGPFTDTARYAFDAGALQFMAVTDHFEHMTAYDWWRNLGLMEAWHAPGRMVDLRAYERSDNLTGHRNVISGGGELPIIGYRNQYHPPRDAGRADVIMELWPQLEELEVITIPHTTAGMFGNVLSLLDWLSFDPAHDRLVEIFQAYRGASEMVGGPRAIDVPYGRRLAKSGLDGGLHFGFIASSDHQSTYGSFAGTWVTGLTRGEVFGGLHERLTFASTCKMALYTEWNGVPMGQAAHAPAGPTSGLQLEVTLFDRELDRVELLVDGEVIRTAALSGSSASHRFDAVELSVPDAGGRYAYVRVYTTDGELGWSSPIRLTSDPAYGPDGPMGFEAFDEETGPALELRPTYDGPDPYWNRWQGPDAPSDR